MPLFHNLKTSIKIVLMLGLIGVVALVLAGTAARRLATVDERYNGLISEVMEPTIQLSRADRSLSEMSFRSYQTLVYDGRSATARAAAAAQTSAFTTAIAALKLARAGDPAAAPKIDAFTKELTAVQAIYARGVARGLQNDNDVAKALLVKGDAVGQRLGTRLSAYTTTRIAAANAAATALEASNRRTSKTMIQTAIASVVAGIALAMFVTRRSITRPLDGLRIQMGTIAGGHYEADVAGADRTDEVGSMARAVQVFRENGLAKHAADAAKARADADQAMVVATVSAHLADLSDGDLTRAIDGPFPPDYAALQSNFNAALAKLRELIGAVSNSAGAIRTGSGEIAQASEDLAKRTEGNAASLEETTAFVTQMDGRLKATAVAASATVQRADQAIATVGTGRAVADEAVQAMGRVSASAEGIDSVIEGLDKIAFQTRVLAMNAAVEAGRAGDAGRGFAVVADLVSALAMRAEEEAKRARDQLSVTQTEIVNAVDAVTKVDDALSNISGDVTQVHDLLATIAADNLAQSAGITQIVVAIGAMDQATQQNASMVEQTSAAARNLAEEVNALAGQAARFTIGRPDAAVRVTPAKRYVARLVGDRAASKPSPAATVAAAVAPIAAAPVYDDDDWQSF